MKNIVNDIKHITHLLLAILLLGFTSACSDLLESDGPQEPGESTVTLSMVYTPSMAVTDMNKTRSAGNAIQGIDNVYVVFFNTSGVRVLDDYFVAGDGRLSVDDSYEGRDPDSPCNEDIATSRAVAKIVVPKGDYHVYAVANMNDLRNNYPSTVLDSEEAFKKIHFEWDETSVSLNKQMSGVFTDDINSNPDEAPKITIGRQAVTLHSWVKRQASKVTVAFDGRNLNDNIRIHILSVQVKDIASHGTLIDPNCPGIGYQKSDINNKALTKTDGDIIVYATEEEYESSPITVTKRDELFGSHEPNAEAVFFYENMQGTHANKHKYSPDKYVGGEHDGELVHLKDDVPNGTYVEVKGYYWNRNLDRPSHGPIVYRFMLGQNVTDDFNAKRNTHYKLTLKFKNDANDPDWHIEYDHPAPPSLEISTPLYMSYMYNTYLNIPLVLYYDTSMDPPVVKIKATIERSDWGPTFHKYYNQCYTDPKYGFMTFQKPGSVTGTVNDFQPTIEILNTELTLAQTTDKAFIYNLPIYTQALNMEYQFTGNNPFINAVRLGNVAVQMWLEGSETPLTGTTQIIQVKRIENPKAKWWPYNKANPFHVVLMESNTPINVSNPNKETYYALESEGTWSAKILYGAANFEICRTKTGTYTSTDEVTGHIGEHVEFYAKPKGPLATDGSPKFGVLEILYNNLTCKTLMLLVQGYGDCHVGDNYWEMANLEKPGVSADNPVKEGSMFKVGNPRYAFKAEQNLQEGFRAFQSPYDKKFTAHYYSGPLTSPFDATKLADKDVLFGLVEASDNNASGQGFNCALMQTNGYRVARGDDYKVFDVVRKTIPDDTPTYDNDRYLLNFGIIYGDECDEPLTGVAPSLNPCIYTKTNDKSGMRACFIFDKNTEEFLILPIGNNSCGRRQHYNWLAWGMQNTDPSRICVLKYADRVGEMPEATALGQPLLYDIYSRPGAIYLYEGKYTYQYKGSGGATTTANNYAFDINYFSYQTNDFGSTIYNATYNQNSSSNQKDPNKETIADPTYFSWPNSNAAYVRRVRITP